MTRRKPIALDFEVDKLTNSIENVLTGDSFPTRVILASYADLKSITKKSGWEFDWKYELKQPEREVYKLTVLGSNVPVIQGLISIETKADHIFMHLVESAPFNKGKSKVYAGVPGNLVHLPVGFLFKEALKAMFPLFPKHSLLIITQRL